jgi:rhodanese-related sulfurtransferase
MGSLLAVISNLVHPQAISWQGLGIEAIDTAREAARRWPEVDYTIDAVACRRHFDQATAVFLDARSEAEFAAGHLPGAVSLPWHATGEVTARRVYQHLPPGLPVLVYGTGPECPVANRVVNLLRRQGVGGLAVFLPGYPGLLAADLPAETGAWRE